MVILFEPSGILERADNCGDLDRHLIHSASVLIQSVGAAFSEYRDTCRDATHHYFWVPLLWKNILLFTSTIISEIARR